MSQRARDTETERRKCDKGERQSEGVKERSNKRDCRRDREKERVGEREREKEQQIHSSENGVKER